LIAVAFNRNTGDAMKVRKFGPTDATFERSPGQDGDVFAGNVVDQRHGAPMTIGYGRYAPNQRLVETLAVDDVMIVIEGRLSVSTGSSTETAGPGEIIHMPKGEQVTIRSHDEGALTAYVTYPHWQEAQA
jgi:ethanolamine utilization protein EutQ (cupin superfamily)